MCDTVAAGVIARLAEYHLRLRCGTRAAIRIRRARADGPNGAHAGSAGFRLRSPASGTHRGGVAAQHEPAAQT